MDMQEFVQLNTTQAVATVDAADVLVVAFTVLQERLLADFRTNEVDAPMVKVVRPLGSVQERLRELRTTRPRFSTPEHFMFFVWPKSVQLFVDTGVWQRIADRCTSAGYAQTEQECGFALQVLRQLERTELEEAIRGQRYRTLWGRPR
jgi:hypothetical protein